MSGGRRVRVIGGGRAGRSFAAALGSVGWHVEGVLVRGEDPAAAALGVDLLVVATPDDVVAEVAAAVEPQHGTVVSHLSGSLGLAALAPHPRRAPVHPLVSLPSPEIGARRLLERATFALSEEGDPLGAEVVADLGGRAIVVPEEGRTAYHAAACIASNHLVALLGQVERVAAAAGVPLEAYLDLVRRTVDNVETLGVARALTGPAARGDERTLERHRAALPADERAAYDVLVAEAARLARRRDDERSEDP